MSGASTYTADNILNALLQGVPLPLPTGTYVSLHTGDPGKNGANEVSLSDWPSYVRRKAEGAGTIGSGWQAATDGVSKNINQIVFPGHNGVAAVTVSYFAIWDALTAGHCLNSAPITTPRLLETGDILVFDAASLTVTVE